MPTAEFRFYEELNDFLNPERRGRPFACSVAENATVKQAVESLGVPHTEVELILVNGAPVGFSHRISHGDRVSVYPVFESFDVTPVVRPRAEPLRRVRFLADAHLGALAKRLRLLGFDTERAGDRPDSEIAHAASAERRVLLSRDRELLKRKQITHGCYIRQTDPDLQLAYVVQRLDLRRAARPFTRCIECNGVLEAAEKDAVSQRVPQGVARRFQRFWACPGCKRVYWRGSHFEALAERVSGAIGVNDD